jgi:hypothetical protein
MATLTVDEFRKKWGNWFTKETEKEFNKDLKALIGNEMRKLLPEYRVTMDRDMIGIRGKYDYGYNLCLDDTKQRINDYMKEVK